MLFFFQLLYTSSSTPAKPSTVDFDAVVNDSKPIFQGINFNETENDNSSILNETETYDENHEIMIITTDDVTTVTPDSGEVKAKSIAIFGQKPRVIKTANDKHRDIKTENVRTDNIKMINLSMTINHINQSTTHTTDIVSQSQHISDNATSIQTDLTIKSHLATERATSTSLDKLLSFDKEINTQPLSKTIDPDMRYVPRFQIKMNNEIDDTDHTMQNSVLQAVRYKRDIETINDPRVQYAPVDLAFRAQISDAQVVPPKPKFNRPIATRTTLKYLQKSKFDKIHKNIKGLKRPELNKKVKVSKKFNNFIKRSRPSMIKNITSIEKSQKYLQQLYLDMKSPTEVTKTKSNHHYDKSWLRVKRDLPESTTENVATIEEPKDTPNLKVTTSSVIEQTVPNTVLNNLNKVLSKNLNEAVHEVFDELNMTALTPPDNKLPGSDLLFKIPSK